MCPACPLQNLSSRLAKASLANPFLCDWNRSRQLSPMLSRASPHNIMLAWNEANSSRSTSPTYDRRDVVPARLLPEARARRLAAKPATPIKGKSTRKAAPAAWWKRLLRLA